MLDFVTLGVFSAFADFEFGDLSVGGTTVVLAVTGCGGKMLVRTAFANLTWQS